MPAGWKKAGTDLFFRYLALARLRRNLSIRMISSGWASPNWSRFLRLLTASGDYTTFPRTTVDNTFRRPSAVLIFSLNLEADGEVPLFRAVFRRSSTG
jgi:hypothetical protein